MTCLADRLPPPPTISPGLRRGDRSGRAGRLSLIRPPEYRPSAPRRTRPARPYAAALLALAALLLASLLPTVATAQQSLTYSAAPTALTVGTAVTLTATAGGFTAGTVSYEVTTGTLPPGLELSSTTGVITGAPPTVSASSVTVTVTASAGTGTERQTATADITFPAVLAHGPEGLDGEDGVVSGSGQVTLRWEVPKGAGPFGYAVHYHKAGTQEAHTQVTGLSATTYTVTGLENGVAYAFQVRSETGGVPSGWAPERPVTATPVAVPANLEADSGDRQVTLEWEAASGADAYEVRWRPPAETGWSGAVIETTALSQVVTGLTNLVAYGFQVRGKNATGFSAWGPEPALRARPVRPVGVVAVAAPEVGDGRLYLSWSPVRGAVRSYEVRYRASGTTTAHTRVTGLSGTAYTVSSLTNGTAYALQVRAVDAVDTPGPWSPPTPLEATPSGDAPGAPGNVSVSGADGAVTVGWTVGSGATSHEVRWRPASEGEGHQAVAGPATSARVTGLVNGRHYTFQVRSKNASGVSAWGPEPAPAMTPLATAPPAPSDLAARGVDAQVRLTWSVVTGASSYALQWKASTVTDWGASSGVTTVDPARSPAQVSRLTNGTRYDFRVRSRSGEGAGAWSGVVSETPVVRPAVPANLRATLGDAQATLAWDAVTGADSYDVRDELRDVLVATGLTTTDYTAMGLRNGGSYLFQVRAVQGGVDGDWSARIHVVTGLATPLAAPANLGLADMSGLGLLTVELRWDAVAGVRHYETSYRKAGGSYRTRWWVDRTAGTFDELVDGETYEFQVRAWSGGRLSPWAPVPALRVTAGVIPGFVLTPAALTVTEDASATYTVKLASQPSATVTVTVGGTAGTDVTVDTDGNTSGSQSTLTFTRTNWSTAQTVTVTVAAGADTDATDDTVTLAHTASGGGYALVTGDLVVTVGDDDSTNQAPSITDITDRTATFGTNLLVDVDATDADAGDTLEYKAASSDATIATVTPTALTAHDASSQVTVTPVGAGTATIIVTVNDGTVDETTTFTVEVSRATLATPVVTLAAGDTRLTPSWADVPSAASYELQWKRATTTDWSGAGVTTVASATSGTALTGLTNGQAHDVRVRAKAASASTTHQDSAWSDVKQGTPAATDTAPGFASETIAAQTWTVGTDVDLTLPAATGGNGTVSYELTPALPSGVTVDTSTRKISGAPRAAASAATYTWRAKDSDANTATSDTVTLTFSVTVGKGTLATPENLAVKANTRTQTGFTVTWDAVSNASSYTATATPSGGAAVTGTVDTTGTSPEAAFTGLTASTTYTVSITATGNASYADSEASDGFDVTTLANQAPTVGTEIPNQTATVDTAFSYVFPATTFSDADSDSLTYEATKSDDTALPSWLAFTAAERKLAGTPKTGDTGTLMVKVTASDGNGGSVSDTFDIEVSAAATPSLTYPALPTVLRAGVKFETLTPSSPANFRAGSTFSYAVTDGTLPSGLSINANTGAISGTPDTPKDTRTSVTVTVTGKTGAGEAQQTRTATATLDFPRIFRFKLPAPTVTLAVGGGQLTAIWDAVANAASYELQWKASTTTGWSGSGVTTVDPATPGTVITGLTNGTPYDVRVRSKAVAGSTTHIDGDWPSAVQGVPAAAPTFSVSGPATVAEDAGTATYTVKLSAEPAANVTVDYATSNGTATSGSDYTAKSGTLTFTTDDWDTNQTVAVTITNDSVDESNETFILALSNAGTGAVLSTTSASVTTTITDNDTVGLTYSAAPTSLTVGTPVSVTATATGFGSATVSYEVTTGTLPGGLKLNGSTGAVTGAPTAVSASAVTVTVSAKAGSGATAKTATANITFPAVGKGTLATPENLAVKASSKTKTGFAVTWDAVSNASSYTATAAVGDATAIGAVDGTEATFTGLAVGTTYTVSVKATGDASYNDSAAKTLSVATAANATPSITDITNKTATFGTNLLVDVDATDANGEDTLQYKAASDDATVATVSPTALTDHGDSSQVRVTPVGEGTATITVTVSDRTASATDTFEVTVSKAALAKPVVTVTARNAQLTATWANVANADSYEVQYKESDETTWLDSSDDDSPAEITGLANGEEYDVRVRAKAASGSKTHADSGWSELAHAEVDTGHRVGPIRGVRGLAAEAFDGKLKVTWRAATDAPGGYLVRWRVRREGSKFTSSHRVREQSGTSQEIGGLTNGTTYVVRVDKLDANGDVLKGAQSAVAGTPAADEDAAVFSVSGPATVGEGAGTATYAVSLSAQPGSNVTVDYATSDGTATAGSDYTAASGALTFTTENWSTGRPCRWPSGTIRWTSRTRPSPSR